MRIRTSRRNDRSLTRLAAITMVRDERVMLPRWLAHYGRECGTEHLYVIDDNTTDGSTDGLPCSVIRIPSWGDKHFEQTRMRMVSRIAAGLLEVYDAVLFADADEFLVADPERHDGLVDLLAKRPAAILLKKMASLNANTTAKRSSALSSTEGVVDFMNEYGDRVAAVILRDEPDLAARLDIHVSDDIDKLEGLMRRMTGRIPLLSTQQQKDLYDRIESEYTFYVEQLEAEGNNLLEAKTLELDARPLRTIVLEEGEGESPFAAGVNLTEYDVKRQGKPYTVEELIQDLAGGLGVERSALPHDPVQALIEAETRGREVMDRLALAAWEPYGEFREKYLARITDEKKLEAHRTRFLGIENNFETLAKIVFPGNRVRLVAPDGESMSGIILRVTPPPASASSTACRSSSPVRTTGTSASPRRGCRSCGTHRRCS